MPNILRKSRKKNSMLNVEAKVPVQVQSRKLIGRFWLVCMSQKSVDMMIKLRNASFILL